MLFIAEGRINRQVEGTEHTVAAAWLGPMMDSGFLQSGYLDAAGQRVFMVLSAPDHVEVEQWIGDLPIVHEGTVTFSITQVTALRFT
ncbi:MAG: hypothetical protein QOG07_3879 [Pseudonocardiales bacterium]|jgi:hypothetical protein|nr:hypothetical protein [Pseudonocardiales bacterium]MDT4903202.1 hypothetical protein [Pseudonocardiales bacterium]MDT4930097.1 hypothetical protein [Pseudonocardiales bacterium]MDT4982000.1 hypothetical protein [Pseudonocardiales bacterium]MDT4983113.1 hypothetical protein [Pseudonocardiales bacterium]